MQFHLDNPSTLRIGEVRIQFQRTLRIPDDGRSYPLPPGLGAFPIRRVDDYLDRVPAHWRQRGGVFIPMYQREAMWIRFMAPHHKPRAIKVGIGKVCALTGLPWSESLRTHPQDYVVAPTQPWLDGIFAGEGTIRQFVAMPLGMGYTVEGQITGEERFGGVQLKVFDPKPGRFPDHPPVSRARAMMPMACAAPAPSGAGQMGLAAGGRMKQKIYPDAHGLDTWDPNVCGRVFVHIVNSALWREITGEEPPSTPVTARSYAQHGLPWFDLYDEHLPAVSHASPLKTVKSVKQVDGEKSTLPLQDDASVEPSIVKKIWAGLVRDGDW